MEDDSFQRWARGESPFAEARIWDSWIHQSEEHRARATEAQKLILGMDLEKKERSMALDSWKVLEGKLNSSVPERVTSPHASLPTHKILPLNGRGSGVSWLARVAVAAVMLVTAGILWGYLNLNYPKVAGEFDGLQEEMFYQNIETGYGEQKVMQLFDGTSVVLNANSSIRYGRSRGNHSRVDIELDGEAYFTVPSRGHSDFDEEEELFQVFTKDGVIRVLGTRFTVSSHDNRTVVVLEEGSVMIATADSEGGISEDESQQWVLQPEELAEFSNDSEGLIRKETVNTRIYTSWKDPRLYFENVPVREIIKRYEHTFGIPFTVSDKELLDRTVSGSVENSNLEVMARIFAEILDVTVEVTDNHVHIRNS